MAINLIFCSEFEVDKNQTKFPQATAYRDELIREMVLASSQPWRDQDELNYRCCYVGTYGAAVPVIVAIELTALICP